MPRRKPPMLRGIGCCRSRVRREPMTMRETEKGFQAAIVDLAQRCGWLVYHSYDSRKSTRGFPDLVLVRPGAVIFAEVKIATGTLTMAQYEWISMLESVRGIGVFVWRPQDWEAIVTHLQNGGLTHEK